MKIKIEQNITHEVEIQFPYFTKDSGFMYMFKDEHSCFSVAHFNASEHYEVSQHSKNGFPKQWLLYTAITREEFEEYFNKTLKKIQDEIR